MNKNVKFKADEFGKVKGLSLLIPERVFVIMFSLFLLFILGLVMMVDLPSLLSVLFKNHIN